MKIVYKSHRDQVVAKLNGGVEKNVRDATIILFNALQRKMTGTRSGKTYRIPGTKKYYRASAPGEAPARRTGDTANSYRYVVDGAVGRVGSPYLHALWLEVGTSKMAKRPALVPAMQENLSQIKSLLSRTIK